MSNNNFANFFNSFQAQPNGQQQQLGQNVAPQQPQHSFHPQHQQQQPGQPMSGPSGTNLPPNVNIELLRSMMQQWQAGPGGIGLPPQQQQQQQQQLQQQFMPGMQMGARPTGMNPVLMQQGAVPGNFSNMQQGGAISGAQAAAAASQAAALTRQQQVQQQQQQQSGPQAGPSQGQQNFQAMPPNVMGSDGQPGPNPASLQQAFEMARNGTLSPAQADQLRSFIEAHRNGLNQGPAGTMPPALQVQPRPQVQQMAAQSQQPVQLQRPPQRTMQQSQLAELLQQQQQQQHLQAQQQQPQPQQQGGQHAVRPSIPQGTNPMLVYKALQNRVLELESKVASTVDGEQRGTLENQLADSRRMLETMTLRLSQALQQQQNQQQGQSQAGSVRPPTPQQQHGGIPNNARPSPRPGSANAFAAHNFAQQQQQQQFATLNQSPHLVPGAGPSVQQQQQQPQQLPQQSQQQPLPQQQPGQPIVRPNNPFGLMNLKPEQFDRALKDLMNKRNTPITSPLVISNQRIDMFRFYQAVQAEGGSEAVQRKNGWPQIVAAVELAAAGSSRSFQLANDVSNAYRDYLAPFEDAWQKAAYHQWQRQLQAQAAQRAQVPQGQQQQQQPQQAPPSYPPVRPAVTQMDQQRPIPPAASGDTAVFNGRAINLAPAPIMTPDQLAARNQTQEQFAASFRAAQIERIRQAQMVFNQQQQQQQQNQQTLSQQQQQQQQRPPPQQQPPSFQPAFQNHPVGPQQIQQGSLPNSSPQSFASFPSSSAPQSQSTQPSSIPPQNAQQQGFNAYGPNQAAIAAAAAGTNIGNQGPNIRPNSGNAEGTNPEPKLIPVSEALLEEARAVMGRIDEELSRTRPRLSVNTEMPESEREEVLNEIATLTYLLDTVNALLPVFYAMQGHLEPAKRLKIMAYMFRDQLDLLPTRQCILRKADLDKLKMQMSRCISYVKASNPTISNFIIEEHRKEMALKREQAFQHQQQLQMQMQQHHAAQQQQQQQQQQMQSVQSGTDDSLNIHGIKRGLRVEDLKQPPVKKGKNGVASVKGEASPPQAAAVSSPPETAANAKGKRAPAKSKAKKGAAAANTSAGPGKPKAKTSQDILMEVKAEMAEAARIKEEQSATAQSASGPSVKIEMEMARLAEETESARKDPATFVEAAWQEMFTLDGQSEANDSVAMTDAKSLESILSMLGQRNEPSAAPTAESTSMQAFNMRIEPSPPSAMEQADAQIDIDLLDFIDAEAMAPESQSEDPQAELDQLLAMSSSSAFGDTPEMVESSRASSSTTSSSLNKKLQSMGFDVAAGTPWSTTSPAGAANTLSSEEEDNNNNHGSFMRSESYQDALAKLTGVKPAKDTTLDGTQSNADKAAVGVKEEDWWSDPFEDKIPASQPWAILS